jgi:type II secretory pathway pseudopilin PulG
LRGFSLVETLLALGLSLVVLGVAGKIMVDYSRLTRASRAQSEQVEVAQNGLRTLASWLRQAPEWNLPASGSSDRVVFVRYTEPVDQWLQPVRDTWNPQGSATCTAWQEGEELLASQSGRRWVLCGGLRSFQVNRAEPELLQLRAEVTQGQPVLVTVVRAE